MAVTVALPKLGMTMESAKIQVWLKRDGDAVERDQPILAIETEKAIAEITAPAAGILLTRAHPGDELLVGAPIAELAADRAEYEALRAGTASPPLSTVPGVETETAARPSSPQTGGPSAHGKLRVAPVARALAAEKGIDLAHVPGTGPDGRITKEDVLGYDRARAAAGASAPAPSPSPTSMAAGEGRSRLVPRTGRRRFVAAKMMEAIRDAAQTTHSMEVDATALVALRQDLVVRAERESGVRVTITDLVMKLAALAIQQHPIVNSRYTDEADIIFEDVHMGMATSVQDEDLLVPVIRDIDKKSIVEIARTRGDYQNRASQNRLTPDEMTGSTFTVSSLGMFGLDRFVAIINRPENAILAVGAILDRPWVHEGQVTVRKVMSVTLTYDHRTIYGAEAARFMNTLKSYLEDPRTAPLVPLQF